MIRQLLVWSLGMLCMMPGATPTHDAAKTMTFLVPFTPGSATDQLARILAQSVTQQTGWAVVVENKPGGNAMIGAQHAARATKDGSLVFITTNTTQSVNPHLYKYLGYDPVHDFEPVTLLGRGGQMVLIRKSLPVTSVSDFIKLARAQPHRLMFGAGNSSSRVSVALFQQLTNTHMLYVPYKSVPPALSDLMGGQIDFMISDIPSALPHVKAGKIRALAVSTLQRNPVIPELPTLHELGLSGFDMSYWFAAYVPAGTPSSRVQQLHQVLTSANQNTPVLEYYKHNGLEPLTATPAQLRQFQAQESDKWKAIVAKAHIEKE